MIMENFFIDDKYYNDLADLAEELDPENEDLSGIEDDWNEKIELSELEPMFQLTPTSLCNMLCDHNEERFSEDMPEADKIHKALKESIDFEKLNSMIPKLYYGSGKFVTITKKDLLEYIN